MPFDQIRVEMAKRREREREKGNRNRFRNNGTRNTEWNFDYLRMDFFVCLILCVCVLSFLYCSVESSFPSSFVLVSPLVRVCISFYLGSFIGGCFSLDPNQTNFSCCFFSFSSPFHRSNGAASGKLRNSSTKIYSNEHPQSGWFHLYAVRKGAGHRI